MTTLKEEKNAEGNFFRCNALLARNGAGPIAGEGQDQFPLRLKPDGIDGFNRRSVPSADDPANSVDHNQLVVSVNDRCDTGIGFVGCQFGIDVEKRELELVPLAQGLNRVSDGVVVLAESVKVVGNE